MAKELPENFDSKNKLDKVDWLIKSGRTFAEVCKLADTKESFVKSRYTYNGLEWREYIDTDKVVDKDTKFLSEKELKELKEAQKPKVVATIDESAYIELLSKTAELVEELEESNIQSLEDEEDEAEPLMLTLEEKELLEEIADYSKDYNVIQRQKTKLFIDNVTRIITEQDFHPANQIKLNLMMGVITPRPAPLNLYKGIYSTHYKLREIFNRKNLERRNIK